MKFLFALLLAATTIAAQAADRKPNIVYILADDLGYGEVGCYGPKEVPTPHIDSIATNGVRFTSGYVSAPVCSPTRAGFLTGRYQQRFGLELNPVPPAKPVAGFGLPLTEKTIGDRLKPLGYATAWIGKSHLGFDADFHPMKRGFDDFFGFLGGAHPYQGDRVDKDNPILRGTEPVVEKDYLTTAFGREAVSFIDRHKEEPFFLYLAFNGVHSPLQAPKALQARFKDVRDGKRRIFNAMLTAVDDAVGAVLTKLRESNLEENTLVVFFSDNGGPTLQTTCRNSPLRGYKGQTLEGGVRVPFLMQWKGKLPAGTVYEAPVSSLDLHPTAMAAAGAEITPELNLDGVDLVPHITGDKPEKPHDALYWRFGDQAAIRQGDWKLVRYTLGRTGRQTSAWELYDLENDPSELRDVINDEPDKKKQLEDAWNAWNTGMGAPKGVKERARPRRKAASKKEKPAAVEAPAPVAPEPAPAPEESPR